MKFLLIHNSYQHRGGEDHLFQTEKHMLASRGHTVIEYRRDNCEILNYSVLKKFTLPARTIWAWDSYQAVDSILRRERPSVALIYNLLPLISPAVAYACRNNDVPVILHIQNYRHVCPAGTLFRDGHICEECKDHGLWRSILHGCYHDSHAASAVVATMLAVHRATASWKRAVDCFITPSRFIREIAIQGGIPANRIMLKPNCVDPDPGLRNGYQDFALYAGRLSPEKGLRTLLRAWSHLDQRIPLKIAGDGPLRGDLENMASSLGLSDVEFLGGIPRERVLSLMKATRLFLFPSECYEGFPMSIVEAFACGSPLVASNIGASQELIKDKQTGLIFRVGDPVSLADTVSWALNHVEELLRISNVARAEYTEKYTGERNCSILVEAAKRLSRGTQDCHNDNKTDQL